MPDAASCLAAIERFTQCLQAVREAPHTTSAFVQAALTELPPVLPALPPRFATVLHDLLDRLATGALFSEESCSFSQRDLLDSLQLWADKAREQCARTAPAA